MQNLAFAKGASRAAGVQVLITHMVLGQSVFPGALAWLPAVLSRQREPPELAPLSHHSSSWWPRCPSSLARPRQFIYRGIGESEDNSWGGGAGCVNDGTKGTSSAPS